MTTPALTKRVEPSAIHAAVAASTAGLGVAAASSWTEIPSSSRRAGLGALLLNSSGVAASYSVARAGRVSPAERVIVVLGSTTRQFAVAAFVALTLCRDPGLLVPAIAYCLVMWLPGGGLVLLARRTRLTAAPSA